MYEHGPSPDPSSRDATALVLSTDAVAAALIGVLLETLGLHPTFADNGEAPRDSLRRLRPRLVLVDCEHGDACSDAFFGPARMMGSTIVLFGGARSAERVRELADKHGVRVLVLPAPIEDIRRALQPPPAAD